MSSSPKSLESLPGTESSNRPARDKLLVNPAVEFMETRANQGLTAVAENLGQGASVQYDPVKDRWVPQEDLLNTKQLYQASEVQRNTLQVALIKFSQSVERYQAKYPKKAHIIPIKPLHEYQSDDVRKVIQNIEDLHKFKGYPKGLQALGKSFEQTMKSRGTLKLLLDFVPRDSYCAPICGSFSFILAALDRAGDFREKVVELLSTIPTQLESIKSLMSREWRSEELQICADDVFACLFRLLGSLVTQLTERVSKKFSSSLFQSYASAQITAMKEFTASIERFRHQVSHDSHLRIGDMDQGLQQLCEDHTKSAAFAQEAFGQLITENRKQNKKLSTLYNFFYGLYASSSRFPEQFKQVDTGMFMPPTGMRALEPKEKPTMSPSRDKVTRALIRSWIAEVKLRPSTATKDRKRLLKCFDDLDIDDKDILWWVLRTTELKDWLNTGVSQNLFVEAETPPDKLVNPLCFAAAFLADCIQSMADSNIHVLTYLTPVRRDRSSSSMSAEMPLRIINHLNCQLLSSICEKRLPIDLSTLIKTKKSRSQTQRRLSAALDLTRAVLNEMQTDSIIFIVVDSGSAHDGLDDENDEVSLFKALLELGDDTGVVVKVLLTDTLTGLASALKKSSSFEVLYVPQFVDGDQQDLAFQTLTEDVKEPAMASFSKSLQADRARVNDQSESEDSALMEYALSSTSETD